MLPQLPAAVRFFLCSRPTDMRKSFDGLFGMGAGEFLGQDPLSGHLFLFLNRRRDRVKILFYVPSQPPRRGDRRRRDHRGCQADRAGPPPPRTGRPDSPLGTVLLILADGRTHGSRRESSRPRPEDLHRSCVLLMGEILQRRVCQLCGRSMGWSGLAVVLGRVGRMPASPRAGQRDHQLDRHEADPDPGRRVPDGLARRGQGRRSTTRSPSTACGSPSRSTWAFTR